MTELGLGTAQFGSTYGITNRVGKVPQAEVARILGTAADAGVSVLDTAPAYGEAEAVLGRAANSAMFKVVTKSPIFGDKFSSSDAVAYARQALEDSLKHLNADSVSAYLVHHADDLLGPVGSQLYEAMIEWRGGGLCSAIGVSVYDGDQIWRVLDRYDVDIIQLPISVFDQRLLADGTLSRLRERNVEIHARSVFLQGIALADTQSLEGSRQGFRHLAEQFSEGARSAGVSRAALALQFIRELPEISVALVGVTNVGELKKLLDAWTVSADAVNFDQFACDDESLVNPILWKESVS